MRSAEQRAAHQAAIAANFHDAVQPYLANEGELRLRDHQPSVMGEIDAFMTATSDEVGRSLLVPLPPNAGKSTMAALCMSLTGVGSVVPETGQPLRGISLVPRVLPLQQTMEAYDWIAPHLSIERYKSAKGPEAYSDIDVVGLTTRAASSMPEEDWVKLIKDRDFFGVDEVHRAIGPVISERIRLAREVSELTLLASSATPAFTPEHNAQSVLGIRHSTEPMTQREAIIRGIANEAQLYALSSGETIFFDSKRESITEEDVRPLMDRPARNAIILDTMLSMAEMGRQGIVQLIPGEDSLHARIMADAACKLPFIDPRTGIERKLKVEAVGKFNTSRENLRIIEEFKAGRLDSLTFTKYLTEAFDSPLGYEFFGCPLGSRVDAEQLAGRGGRFYGSPTIYFCIIDRYASRAPKRIWTPFDVFGEDQIYQGKRILSNVRRKDKDLFSNGQFCHKPPFKHTQARENTDNPESFFSERVNEALGRIPSGTVLDELLITREKKYDEVPPGYVPIHSLPAIQEGLMTVQGARYQLMDRATQDGKPLFLRLNTGLEKQFVLLTEADAVIRSRYVEPGKISRMDISNFLIEQGWPRLSFDAFNSLCDETGTEYDASRKSIIMDARDVKRILMYLKDTSFVDPSEELTISSVATAIGHTSSSQLMRIIKKNSEVYEQHLHSRRRGVPPTTFKQVQALTIEGIKILLDEAANTSPQLRQMLKDESMIDALIADIQQGVRKSYWSRKMDPKLSEEAIDQFLAHFLPGSHVEAKTSEATPPPSSLDESYRLSSHGKEWRSKTACNDENAELFFSPEDGEGQRELQMAKEICARCVVKGDCLLFSVEHNQPGVAGGLSETERAKLGSSALEWLRNSRQT